MASQLVSAVLIIVGLIHIYPLRGVLGTEALAALYGTGLLDRDVQLLLQHRAVLFGIQGIFFIISAFLPAYQWAALSVGIISTASFIGFAWAQGEYHPLIQRVVIADYVALLLLLIAVLVLGFKSINQSV